MQFLGLSGSLRSGSTNSQLLRALDACHEGHKVGFYSELAQQPLFDPDMELAGAPAVIARFVAEVRAADGLIIAAPEYAHGIPGALKNALDWLVSDTHVPHKPVMLVHASTRSHHSRMHLREVLTTMSLSLFAPPEFECHLMGMTANEVDQRLADPDILARMRTILDRFADFIHNKA